MSGYKLFFDTSDRFMITVRLFKNTKLVAQITRRQKFTSQVLLPVIIQVCQDSNISLKEIEAVEINPGPGSYTGLKVGCAVANCLSWYLKIPVNGWQNKIVIPVFE